MKIFTALTFLSLIFLSLGQAANAQRLLIEDFENGVTGEGTNNWKDDQLDQWGITTDPTNSANNVLWAGRHFFISTRDGVYMNYEFTYGPTGRYFARVGFDFYADEGIRSDTYEIDAGIGSYYHTAPTTLDSFAVMVGIRYDSTNGYHLRVKQPGMDGDERPIIKFNWIPKKWYNIAFEMNTSTKTFELFVNDTKMFYDSDGNGSLDKSTFDFDVYSLDLYSFGVNTNGRHGILDTDESIYIDNITFNSVPEPGRILGDTNDDGNLDFGDIETFFIAITDPFGYMSQYPDIIPNAMDMNRDGNTDSGDIEGFFIALTGG